MGTGQKGRSGLLKVRYEAWECFYVDISACRRWAGATPSKMVEVVVDEEGTAVEIGLFWP